MYPLRYLFIIFVLGSAIGLHGIASSARAAALEPDVVRGPQGLQIVTTGPATPGATNCVTVVNVGANKTVAVTIEINGVEVPVLSMDHRPDGTTLVCYPVPMAGGGGTVTVTANSGGSAGVATLPVSL